MRDRKPLTYAETGVNLKAANETSVEIMKRLEAKGQDTRGLFGGGVDVSQLKGEEHVYIGVSGFSLDEQVEGPPSLHGTVTACNAFSGATGTVLAAMDYFASPKMVANVVADFVESVANECIEEEIPLVGGESAEMEGTYNEGQFDAFVHLIERRDNPKESVDIADLIKDMKKPLLVGTCDGTGTKTKVVKNPRDVIYHGLNDDAAQGAEPIAAAIYISGNVPMKELEEILEDARQACEEIGIAFLTPIVEVNAVKYQPGEVDIAASVLSLVDEEDMITGENVEPSDVIIGISVDGLMTNGYSLARKAGSRLDESWDTPLDILEGSTVRKELSKPHVPMTDILFGYEGVEGILSRYKGDVHAMAHITGGGQIGNIRRTVPDEMSALIGQEILPIPPLMNTFIEEGIVKRDECYRVFNMGVGFTLTVSSEKAGEIADYINENFKDRKGICERRAATIGYISSAPKAAFVDPDASRFIQ